MGDEVRLPRVITAAADGQAADGVSDFVTVASRQPVLDGQDPLVQSLAQLVRDRWAAGRARGETALAIPARPSNMRTVDEETEPVVERSA